MGEKVDRLVELTQVSGYEKHTKGGKVVHVGGYNRSGGGHGVFSGIKRKLTGGGKKSTGDAKPSVLDDAKDGQSKPKMTKESFQSGVAEHMKNAQAGVDQMENSRLQEKFRKGAKAAAKSGQDFSGDEFDNFTDDELNKFEKILKAQNSQSAATDLRLLNKQRQKRQKKK